MYRILLILAFQRMRAPRVAGAVAMAALLMAHAHAAGKGISNDDWEGFLGRVAETIAMPDEPREQKADALAKIGFDAGLFWSSPASEEPPDGTLMSDPRSKSGGGVVAKNYYPHLIAMYAYWSAAQLYTDADKQAGMRQMVISSLPNDTSSKIYRLPAVYALVVDSSIKKPSDAAAVQHAVEKLSKLISPADLKQVAPNGQEAFLADAHLAPRKSDDTTIMDRILDTYQNLTREFDDWIRQPELDLKPGSLIDPGDGRLEIRVAVKALAPITVWAYDPTRGASTNAAPDPGVLSSEYPYIGGSEPISIALNEVKKGEEGVVEVRWKVTSALTGKQFSGTVSANGEPVRMAYSLGGAPVLRSERDRIVNGEPMVRDWTLSLARVHDGDRVTLDAGGGEKNIATVAGARADQPYDIQVKDALPLNPNTEQTWTVRVHRSRADGQDSVTAIPVKMVSQTVPQVTGEVRPLGASGGMAYIHVDDYAPVGGITVDGLEYPVPASIEPKDSPKPAGSATRYTFAIPLLATGAGGVEATVHSTTGRDSRPVTLAAVNAPVTVPQRDAAAKALGLDRGDPLAELAAADVANDSHKAVAAYLALAAKDGDPRQKEAQRNLGLMYDRIVAALSSKGQDALLGRLKAPSGPMTLIAQRTGRDKDRLAMITAIVESKPVSLAAGAEATLVAPGVARIRAKVNGFEAADRRLDALTVGDYEITRSTDDAAFARLVSNAENGAAALDLLTPAPDAGQDVALRVTVRQTIKGQTVDAPYDLGRITVGPLNEAAAVPFAATLARMAKVAGDPNDDGDALEPWLRAAAFRKARETAETKLSVALAALRADPGAQTALGPSLDALDFSERTRKRDPDAVKRLRAAEMDVVQQVAQSLKVDAVFKAAAASPDSLAPDASLTVRGAADIAVLVNGEAVPGRPIAGGSAYTVAGLPLGGKSTVRLAVRLRDNLDWTADLPAVPVEVQQARRFAANVSNGVDVPIGNAWPVNNTGDSNLEDIKLKFNVDPWARFIKWKFVSTEDGHGHTKGDEFPLPTIEQVSNGEATLIVQKDTLPRGHWNLIASASETKDGLYSPADKPTPVNVVGRGVAFVMGIDYYRTAPLNNPANDAKDLVDKLINDLHYDPENVIYVYGTIPDRKPGQLGGVGRVITNYRNLKEFSPTKVLVDSEMANEAWGTFINKMIPAREPRHVLIYYAGHGAVEDQYGVKLSTLVMANGAGKYAIPVRAWTEQLSNALGSIRGKFRTPPTTIALFNACRPRTDDVQGLFGAAREVGDPQNGYAPFFSCAMDQFANDNSNIDGHGLEVNGEIIQNTFFGYALIKAILGDGQPNTVAAVLTRMVTEMNRLMEMAREKNKERNLPQDEGYADPQTIVYSANRKLDTIADVAYIDSDVQKFQFVSPP